MNFRTVSVNEIEAYVKHLVAQRGVWADNIDYTQGMLDLAASILPQSGTLSIDAATYSDDVFGSQVVPEISVTYDDETDVLTVETNGGTALDGTDLIVATVDAAGATAADSDIVADGDGFTMADASTVLGEGDLTSLHLLEAGALLASWSGTITLATPV